MELTKELIEKAKACRTAEELMALAQENGYDLSPEEAELFLQESAEGEIPDEKLNNVSGGAESCAGAPSNRRYEVIYWKNKEDVQFIANVGDVRQVYSPIITLCTYGCKVLAREARFYAGRGYADVYYLQQVEGKKCVILRGWYQRNFFDKE